VFFEEKENCEQKISSHVIHCKSYWFLWGMEMGEMSCLSFEVSWLEDKLSDTVV
jgi:hypothetical protein